MKKIPKHSHCSCGKQETVIGSLHFECDFCHGSGMTLNCQGCGSPVAYTYEIINDKVFHSQCLPKGE